jgi:hypothetical protein
MSGDVHITGSDFPQWASETTLEKLLEEVGKLVGTSSQQKQILDKSLREIQKTGKASPGGQSGKDAGLGKALTSGLKDVTHSALDTVGGFDKLGGPLRNFGKALKEQSAGMKVGLAAIGGFFGMLGKGAAIYKSSADSMISLANSGITIEGSFLGINKTLAETGMSMEQFNEMNTKYARVIGQNGWKAMNGLIQKADEASGGFDKFGLTTADATEYAAEYLDQQRMVGVFSRRTQQQQALALTENMQSLTRYSKVLNVSRDDLQESSRAMLGNADLQAELFSIVDPVAREKAQEAFKEMAVQLGALGLEDMNTYLTDIASSPNPYGSKSYIQLVESGQVELAKSLVAMSNGAKAGEKMTFDQMKNTFRLTEAQIENERALRTAEGSYKAESVIRLNAAQKIAEADEQKVENERKYAAALKNGEGGSFIEWMARVNKDAEGVTSIADGMNKIQATFDRGVIEMTNKMVESFAGKNGIGNIADAAGEKLQGVADYANKWLDDFRTSDDPMTMIVDATIAGLKTILTTVGNLLVAAIQAGFRMLKEGPAARHKEYQQLNKDAKYGTLNHWQRREKLKPLAQTFNDNYQPDINAADTAEYNQLKKIQGNNDGHLSDAGLKIIADYLARQEAMEERAIRAQEKLNRAIAAGPGNAFQIQ